MALHKVHIFGRNSTTGQEDYIDVVDHKLGVGLTTVPDEPQKEQTHVNIDFSDATAQEIIAAPAAGNRIRLTRLSLMSGSTPQINVEIELRSGATPIETVKGDAMVFDYPEHRNLGDSEAFIIKCTTADRVIGGVDYYVEAVV